MGGLKSLVLVHLETSFEVLKLFRFLLLDEDDAGHPDPETELVVLFIII